MKRYKIALAALTLFIVGAACVYPVTANIIVHDPEFDYTASEQKLNVKVIVEGGSETAPASEYPMDIILLLDVSKSMEEKYKEETRLDIAKDIIAKKFLPFPYEKIRVGLITFAKHANIESELVGDLEAVRKKVEDTSAMDVYTNLGEGIEEATKMVKERADKTPLPIIIIFSDGWYEKEVDPKEKAKQAAKEGITIYTIGIGKREEVNEVELRKIAEEAKGKYYYVEDLPKVKKNDPLETILGMDKSFSATNLVMKFEQADALLDYFSHEHPVYTSSEPATNPPVLIERDKFEFFAPTMEEGQKITFVFNVFPPKGGDVNAATLKLYFIDKNGTQARDKSLLKEELKTPVEKLEEEREKMMGYAALIGLLLFILIALIIYGMKQRGKLKKKENERANYETENKKLKNEKTRLEEEIKDLQKDLENCKEELAKREMEKREMKKPITSVEKVKMEPVEEEKSFIIKDRIENDKGGES